MLNTIFLDLDGVCNRLYMHALEHYGYNVSRYDDAGWPLLGCYDITQACTALDPNRDLTGDKIFADLPVEVWATTPPSDEFYQLLQWGEALVGREHIAFLTKPSGDASAAGKVLWIERFAPKWLRKQFFVGSPKWLTARPTALLVDDSDVEVNGFRNRGGCALLVPRPWNSEYSLHPGEKIDCYFSNMMRLREQKQLQLSAPEPEKFDALRQCNLLPRVYIEDDDVDAALPSGGK